MDERKHEEDKGRADSTRSSLEVTPFENIPIKRSIALRRWFLAETGVEAGRHAGPHGRPQQQQRAHWFRVMCLSGLDYFSTLGYQPAIAAVAAGAIAPLATLILVIVTLFAALPVYRKVASLSPHGAGSIAIVASLFPHWRGKVIVLFVLGSAATDFMITMTLSTADATAHLIHNPLVPAGLGGHHLMITLLLLTGLGIVFLRGIKQAILVATLLVPLFFAVNLVVIIAALIHLVQQPVVLSQWWNVLSLEHENPFLAVALAVLIFPKLALGLSGFETGVAVMPQIRTDEFYSQKNLAERISSTKKLLTTSAVIMSGLLIASSLTTVVLIPAEQFQPGGVANGRALAYLAHEYLGSGFGSVYDVVTIAILWFAGASVMAGLLNLVPRYLPHFGMAPVWVKATRPLVLLFTGIAFLITALFDADVEAQGGAYATGVLILISSAAIAVTLSARKQRQKGASIGFAITSVIFMLTTLVNMIERPEGIKVVACFVSGIIVLSFLSRTIRSTELRATAVQFEPQAIALLDSLPNTKIR